ncbi:hypothetical protein H6G00_01490 [Leptolyngbya sp. FACHB-541]|uniref:structural cement protein Gp24 n=1 Tax=Leptolyngbya sp. FACHB-541 TaxID=2692810 RepID=UPI001688102F|nr:hypothetical protein [Leptolyngbya sp. FACHB-541]MBD1995303.1 hypothetical protein [Leptolyngbya sp. FACHB-541]
MQKVYRDRYAVGFAGKLEGYGTPPRVKTVNNASTSRADVWSVPIPAAPTANTVYKLFVPGAEATFTTDANPSQAELEQGLLNAVRLSEIYDRAIPQINLTTHTLTLTARTKGVALRLSSSANLTPVNTSVASTSGFIPFGRIVARAAGEPEGTGRLPTALTDRILGGTMATHASEKVGIGPSAFAAYPPDEAMDVLTNSLTNEGLWIPTIPGEVITEDSSVFVSIAPGHQGKVTANNTNAIALPTSSFRSGVDVSPNGESIIVVSFNIN